MIRELIFGCIDLKASVDETEGIEENFYSEFHKYYQ